MKIIIVSVGTRGDMEPFLAIGELLKAKGHQVLCALPEQFRNLAIESGLEYESLGEKFIDLLESDSGKAAMGGASGWKKFVGTIRLAMRQKNANKEVLFNQKDIIDRFNPDIIIYNGKSVYPILWHLSNNGKIIFVSPLPYMHYVKGHTHIAFNSNYGEVLNKMTFSLAEFGLITTVNMSRKWLKMKEKFKRKDIKNVLKNGKSIYTISPTLFPRPVDWPENLQVYGYHQRSQDRDWKPSDHLEEFVNNHNKILLVTFGSMVNPNPLQNSLIFLDILKRHKIPAIINTAAGGLIQPAGFDEEFIYFVSQIPYEWILPKLYGIIHHGGSGTTHLALRFGCASMIIPHIIDQFAWNSILSDLGVGPKGIKINGITAKNIEPKILDLMNNPIYKKKAEEVGNKMRQEYYRDDLYKAIIN